MRAWLWALVAVAVWALAAQVERGPAPRPADAPANLFSGLRARETLTAILGVERPHPAGSAENAAVHARIRQRLARLGVPATSFTRLSCSGGPAIRCATVTDIVADAVPGTGPAVLLMAHLDSVPAGPGASDDGAGVATLLETIRALKAAPPAARHPVLALFTDGEEDGLLGAAAFVDDPQWRARIGVVINVDSRGGGGESLLFQTSPDDAALIDLYAATAPHPATSSLYREIYKYLHNDTDLTPFLQAGFAGYNFANVDDVAVYHTARDRIAAQDPRMLQSHGDNVLGLTRALAARDFATLKSGAAVYLDVLGLWLPRLPESWALPLALLAFVAIAFGAWRRRIRDADAGRRLLVLAMPPLLLLGATAAGLVLQAVAARVAMAPDPAFAHPAYLRSALAFAVWALILCAARYANLGAIWTWLAAAAVATAWFLPGASPYFLFPSLAAMVTLPFTVKRPWLAVVPALAALIIWLQLAVGFEVLVGLSAPYLFTVPLAMGLMAAAPLLKPRGWRPVALFAGLALAGSVAAGFAPVHDAAHPEPHNILYVEEAGKTYVASQPADRVPAALRSPARFPQLLQWLVQEGHARPAGAPQFALPAASVTRRGDDIALDLKADDGVLLVAPKEAALTGVTINGVRKTGGGTAIFCITADCGHAHLVLHAANPAALRLTLMAWHFGLPDSAVPLLRQRAADAVPIQFGDMSVLISSVDVPAR